MIPRGVGVWERESRMGNVMINVRIDGSSWRGSVGARIENGRESRLVLAPHAAVVILSSKKKTSIDHRASAD